MSFPLNLARHSLMMRLVLLVTVNRRMVRGESVFRIGVICGTGWCDVPIDLATRFRSPVITRRLNGKINHVIRNVVSRWTCMSYFLEV